MPFGFLQPEWPQIYESAAKAESFVFTDPGTACIHARRTLELVMQWIFKSDASLHPPYQQNLSALVHEPTFVQVAGQAIQAKATVLWYWCHEQREAAEQRVCPVVRQLVVHLRCEQRERHPK